MVVRARAFLGRGRWTIFGAWTALALFYVLTSAFTSVLEGESPSWRRSLVWSLTNGYLWMAITPVVNWVSSRFGQTRRRFWSAHFVSSIIISLLQVSVVLAVYWWLCGPPQVRADMSIAEYIRTQFAYNARLSWFTYWVLLAIVRSIEFQRGLREERLRSSRLETQLAQSHLQTLRMQLQPHFLFNTLNAISALTLADPMKARLMVSRLSDFFRLTLEERHAQTVPLVSELELLKCYLGIQEVRFEDRLTTELSAAADTLYAAVPSMILQPIVENALQHGLLAKVDRGTLQIASRRLGDVLVLTVEDDGIGLPAGGPREGVGLSNTRARLGVLFGGEGTMRLERRASGGTRVELTFPFTEVTA